MSERAISWSTSFWLLICASLAGVVAVELSSSLRLAPEVTAAAPAALPAAEPEAPSFSPPPPEAFDEIALRPLFFESRRPFVPTLLDEGPAEEPVAAEKLAVELVGTLVTDARRAALLQPAGQDAAWHREGDKVAGWRVGKIGRDQVMLRQGEESETLDLRADLAGPKRPDKAETRAAKRKRDRQAQAVKNDPTHNN